MIKILNVYQSGKVSVYDDSSMVALYGYENCFCNL